MNTCENNESKGNDLEGIGLGRKKTPRGYGKEQDFFDECVKNAESTW
jgi:hypothetical protein